MEIFHGIPSGYLTVRHGIDGPFIDGLPFLKMGGSFHGELLVITRWYICHFMEIFHGIYMWILDKRSPNYLIGKLGSICGASSKKQLGLTNTKRRGAFRNLAIKKMDHLWDHHLVSHWVTQITIFGKLP